MVQTEIALDLILEERLAALRQLQPEAQLSEPRGGLARQLLQRGSLEEAQGHELAVLALAIVLDVAARSLGMLPRARAAMPERAEEIGGRVSHRYGTTYGNLLTADPTLAASWPSSWVEAVHSLVDAERLVGVLSPLRSASGLAPEPSPTQSLSDAGIQTLIADLLRLPDDVDPIRWLYEERAALCRRLVLGYLTQASLPAENLMQFVTEGRQVRSLRPKVSQKAGDLKIAVEQLDFYDRGSVLHLNVRFKRPEEYQGVPSPYVVRWDGFQRIMDDHGHRYVCQMGSSQTNNVWRGWEQKLALVGWPALDEPRQLLLQADPALLSVYRGQEMTPEPSEALGRLEFAISL